jgi:hypothetical protein
MQTQISIDLDSNLSEFNNFQKPNHNCPISRIVWRPTNFLKRQFAGFKVHFSLQFVFFSWGSQKKSF